MVEKISNGCANNLLNYLSNTFLIEDPKGKITLNKFIEIGFYFEKY